MKILVCYKIVYEEQDITVNPDRSLLFDRAELKLSLYDMNAVEEAVRISEKIEGAQVTALSAGDKKLENTKLQKGILSRGPHELILVQEEALREADTHQTAQVLAAAAKKSGFDLIICGEGSADTYAQQTGIQLGELLGIPVINAVSNIQMEGNKLILQRTLEEMAEELEVMLPAVVCVTSDINETRVPSMKEILGAGKKTVTHWRLKDLNMEMPARTLEILSVLAPQQQNRKGLILEGDDKAAEFFEKIRNEIQ